MNYPFAPFSACASESAVKLWYLLFGRVWCRPSRYTNTILWKNRHHTAADQTLSHRTSMDRVPNLWRYPNIYLPSCRILRSSALVTVKYSSDTRQLHSTRTHCVSHFGTISRLGRPTPTDMSGSITSRTQSHHHRMEHVWSSNWTETVQWTLSSSTGPLRTCSRSRRAARKGR